MTTHTRRGFVISLLATLSFFAVFARVSERAARANGAFPDSQSILMPVDRPHQIILTTNFGLVVSEDDAKTWSWVCEQRAVSMGFAYQIGAAPLDRLFAMSDFGDLAYSDSGGCTWKTAAGLVRGGAIRDYFPDPQDPNRVVAIGVGTPKEGQRSPFSVFESQDGGATFDLVRFEAASGDSLTGIEISRSNPEIVYVTMLLGATNVPQLLRTNDGGATWTTIDLAAAAGANAVRIIAVDPVNPGKVLLRVVSAEGDKLLVTVDAGEHFTTPMTIPGGMLNSFTRLADGTTLLGGLVGGRGLIFRSTDGDQTFARIDAPSLRALAQRAGRLLVASDNFKEGFAIGESKDGGTTWTGLMRYDQVQGTKACLERMCHTDCTIRAAQGLWPGAVCGAAPPAQTTLQPATPETATPVPGAGGCRTGAAGAPHEADLSFVVPFALLLTAAARRRSHR